jgi:succinoglycan biosynthesis protein ExoA
VGTGSSHAWEVDGVSSTPTVTVVIPTRNEAQDIERCLRAVVDQDHPAADTEVIVVDGASVDDTAGVVQRFLRGRGRVVTNPGASISSNLNRGLAEARGRILCRVDARSLIPTDYVSQCVRTLDARPEVIAVGGAQVAVARSASPTDLGIARALNNRYGMGLSRYRRGGTSGPADTVYLGAFRVDALRAVGGWDERLEVNEDYELNRRLAARGILWFVSSLRVRYLPRTSLRALFTQYHRFGRWKVRYWRLTGDRPRLRQLLLLAVPPVALGVLARSRHPTVVLSAGIAVVVVGECVGPTEPEGSFVAHAMSAAASVVIGLAWWTGVCRGVCEPLGGDPARPS